jgi:NTP pyrophosphatase (non-canonical NTP hydrolase)
MNNLNELNALRDAAYANAKEKGFYDTPTPPSVGERIALMHSELSEALEDFRAGHAPNEMWYEAKNEPGLPLCYPEQISGGFRNTESILLRKPCGIPSELADVIIRILDFSGAHNIDIGRAVEEKMAYNRTRPYKHGGKKI